MLQTEHNCLVFTCTSSGLSLREPRLTNMKSIILAAVAAPFIAAPAIAGPYVNVEANSGFTGSDYEGTTTEAHVGYEGDLGENAGYYVQAGPAFVSEDGGETDTELSGKAGVSLAVSDAVEIYGEISFITDEDDNGYGTKLGATYRF